MSFEKDVNISSFKVNPAIPFKTNPELEKVIPMTYQEIVNSKPNPMQYVLYPWLPSQGIAFIYAATGVGKTLFTLNVAYAIASGGDFLKYSSPLPRKVLYIDGEMAYPQVYARFMDVVQQQGKMDLPDNFMLLTPDKIIPNRMPKICSPDGQMYYNYLIDQFLIEVVVFDNLSTLSAIDENKSDEWKVLQDWFIELRARGKTIIIVHHSGKEKKGYRGTSRMLDVADTAISLQDVSQSDLEDDKSNIKKFKIEYQKNRSFGGAEAFSFEVTLTPLGWEFESMEKTYITRIAEMINELKMKPDDIILELGLSRSYVYKLIKKSRSLGLLRDRV